MVLPLIREKISLQVYIAPYYLKYSYFSNGELFGNYGSYPESITIHANELLQRLKIIYFEVWSMTNQYLLSKIFEMALKNNATGILSSLMYL